MRYRTETNHQGPTMYTPKFKIKKSREELTFWVWDVFQSTFEVMMKRFSGYSCLTFYTYRNETISTSGPLEKVFSCSKEIPQMILSFNFILFLTKFKTCCTLLFFICGDQTDHWDIISMDITCCTLLFFIGYKMFYWVWSKKSSSHPAFLLNLHQIWTNPDITSWYIHWVIGNGLVMIINQHNIMHCVIINYAERLN